MPAKKATAAPTVAAAKPAAAKPAAKPVAKPAAAPAPEPLLEIGEVHTFNGYTNLAEGQVAILTDGEYVQVTALSDSVEGTQFYEVQALENTAEQGEEARVEIVQGGELTALTPEQEADIAARFPVEDEAETASEETAEGETAEGETAADGKPAKKKSTKKRGVKTVLAFSGVAAVLAQGGDLVEYAKSLAETAQQTWFDLGETLLIIKQKKAHTLLLGEDGAPLYPESKEGWNAFVTEHIGVGYRTTLFWMKTVKELKRLGKVDPNVLALGWGKLKEVARVLESMATTDIKELAGYVKPLLEYAASPNISVADVKNEVDGNGWITASDTPANADGTAAAPASEELQKRQKHSFFAIGDKNDVINSAIAEAKTLTGSDDEDGAIFYIFEQFLASVSTAAATAPAAAASKAPAAAARPAAKKVAAKK